MQAEIPEFAGATGGAGPGYFTLRLARAVGPSGRVDAVDPEPGVLEALRGRLAQARVHNASCARSPRVERASLPSVPIFSRAGPEDIVARDARIDFRLNVLERKCRVRRDPRSEK